MTDDKTVYPHTEQTILSEIDDKLDRVESRVAWIGWIMMVMFIVLLIAICSGCGQKSLHERAWDADGNLIKKIDVSVWSCMLHTEARNIIAVTQDKFLFVGDLSQVPDSKALAAIAEVLAPWWMKEVMP